MSHLLPGPGPNCVQAEHWSLGCPTLPRQSKASHHPHVSQESFSPSGPDAVLVPLLPVPWSPQEPGMMDQVMYQSLSCVLIHRLFVMFAAVIYPSQVSAGLDGQGNLSFVPLAAADNQVISPKAAASLLASFICKNQVLPSLKLPGLLLRKGRQVCIANRLHIKR